MADDRRRRSIGSEICGEFVNFLYFIFYIFIIYILIIFILVYFSFRVYGDGGLAGFASERG